MDFFIFPSKKAPLPGRLFRSLFFIFLFVFFALFIFLIFLVLLAFLFCLSFSFGEAFFPTFYGPVIFDIVAVWYYALSVAK